jgi:hypothetical protein
MITYELVDSDILFVKLTGNIDFNEVTGFLKKLKSFDNLPQAMKLLCDLTEADVNLSANEIHQISESAENATRKYAAVKTALLVNRPLLTAFSVLYSGFKSSSRTNREVFSTMDAARDWLTE